MQIDNFHFENNDLKHSVPKSNNLSKKILAYRGSFFCKHTKTHTNKGRTLKIILNTVNILNIY